MTDGVVASLVVAFADFAVARGLAREDAMAAAGVSAADLTDPDALVPATALMGLWQLLVSRLPEVVVPLAAADAMVARMGIVGQLLRSAPTLRDALAVHQRFGRLSDAGVVWSADEQDGALRLSLRHRPEVHALGLPIELMVAMAFRLLSASFGGPVPLRQVTFSHPPFYPPGEYERFFGAPVRFAAGIDAIWLEPGLLDRPIERADPELSRYLEAQARRMLADLPPPADAFVERVRAAVARGLAGGDAEQARVARALAVSVRTLQRRLTEAATSFQQVVDDVRRAAAERMLREPQATALDVAFALGYADAPSFHRAFKRWTGKTPQEFRTQAR